VIAQVSLVVLHLKRSVDCLDDRTCCKWRSNIQLVLFLSASLSVFEYWYMIVIHRKGIIVITYYKCYYVKMCKCYEMFIYSLVMFAWSMAFRLLVCKIMMHCNTVNVSTKWLHRMVLTLLVVFSLADIGIAPRGSCIDTPQASIHRVGSTTISTPVI